MRLDLEGMTCASCVNRIERKLNKLEGVEASVNFATEQATVHCDPAVTVDDLVAAVEAAGYQAHPVAPSDGAAGHHHHEESAAALRRRLVVAVALTAPVALLAMVRPLQFSGWEWIALALSTPVVFWSGAGFHRAALQSARHLAATMDTLISIGTLAAWTWSTVVLVGGLDEDVYFEVAAVITTLILLGRFLEARAKSRSSEAIRKLLELGAKDARVLRGGEEVAVAIEDVVVGDLLVVRPGEKIPTDGDVVEGESARRPVAAHGRVPAGRGRAGIRGRGRHRSTRTDASSCARRRSAPTPRSRRSRASSRPRSRERRPCSVSQTASRRCSSPS